MSTLEFFDFYGGDHTQNDTEKEEQQTDLEGEGKDRGTFVGGSHC